MIHKIKNFVACHYLVCAYSMLALVSVLFVLFRNDWKFLVQLIVCLLVILLYAMVCGLGYIFIRAILPINVLTRPRCASCLLLLAYWRFYIHFSAISSR